MCLCMHIMHITIIGQNNCQSNYLQCTFLQITDLLCLYICICFQFHVVTSLCFWSGQVWTQHLRDKGKQKITFWPTWFCCYRAGYRPDGQLKISSVVAQTRWEKISDLQMTKNIVSKNSFAVRLPPSLVPPDIKIHTLVNTSDGMEHVLQKCRCNMQQTNKLDISVVCRNI